MASDEGTAAAGPDRSVVEEMLGAVSRGEISAQLACYTDDVLFELPYADPPVRLCGKGELAPFLSSALEVFELRLSPTRVFDCTQPDTLIVEYTSEGTARPTGKPYRNTYIAVLRFRQGRICAQREYYNPLPAARALAED